ncbi:type II and III secretion system protein family protein [uncultured Selenomonas sp.]|uniref:type II and III secretion system protein family protein n=1 Tax=uncultured Selenomonas sp. TaxID=159275 RepID=UPI0025D29503|nr:pilus assembly protein N-terminal domain-containing protein [uncultured Selenomonas sp.]
MKISRFHKKLALAASFGLASFAAVAPAPAYAYSQPLYLEINQSYYLPQTSAIKRVAVSNPDIADVIVVDKNAISVVAKKSGSTSLTIWNANGMRQEFTVSVTGADSGMAGAIQKAIGLPHVEVSVVGGKVILKGTVANQYEKDLAYRVACLYADSLGKGGEGGASGSSSSSSNSSSEQSHTLLKTDDVTVNDNKETNPNVINLLEMVNPDQINIEALVIEVNEDDAKKLGATYTSQQASSDSDGISVNDAGEFYGGESYGTQRDAGHHWYNRNWFFTHFSKINANIHLLIDQGHARVISRPNITTMSGKTAGILVGGQIPYPTSNSDGNISVEYKDYGIRLNLIDPTVDRSGNITSRVLASVSRLDWTNAVTSNSLKWPAIAERTAETMVNIPTGMTMVIGGLLDSDDTKQLKKVPLLGDIPIIGELFKYHNDSKQKSEIMILITPRIVNETTPANMSPQMRDTYAQDRKDDEAREQVDLNGDRPKTNKELKDEAKAKETEVPPKKSEADDSILGKYLDQSVLKGTSKAEHDAAVKANQQE